MGSLLMMNFLDVARSLGREPCGATPETVSAFIRQEFRGNGGAFNYNTSIGALYDLFRGASTIEEALQHCRTTGAPAGRKPNAEALEIVAGYASEHRSNCYRIPFTAVPVGRLRGERTAYMAVKAPLVRVEGDDVFVVVPGFRKGHRPEDAEIDVAASLALANFARDDFHGADFEYLHAGPGLSGERQLRVIHGCNRQIYSIDEVDRFLDVYVRGLQLAIEAGMPAHSPSFRGYRVIDPDAPRFF